MRHLKHHLFVSFVWDSHQERFETEAELKGEIRPHLEELDEAGQVTAADVDDYVEEWADEHLGEDLE